MSTRCTRKGLLLSFGLFFAAFHLPVVASDLVVHRFQFFIHPDLTTNLSRSVLNQRLVLYVEDLNTIFAKQTIRRFEFNPEQDITITTNTPGSHYSLEPPPTNHAIWAHVRPSEHPEFGTHGGHRDIETNGAWVAAGLHWDAVHDRSTLTEGVGFWELDQYWRQIHHLTHEIEHIFGAGVTEYYNVRYAEDRTGELPVLHLSIDTPEDSYWSQHQDFFTDPLTLWTPQLSYSNLMAQVRFADLTVAILNARLYPLGPDFIHSIGPDLSRTRIVVRDDESGAVIAGARVKVWKVRPFYPYESFLMVDTTSGPDGGVEFAWTDPVGDFSNYNQLILIKAWDPGRQLSAVRWATTIEACEAKMLRSQSVFEIPVRLRLTPELAINRTIAGVEVSWTAAASNLVLQTRNPFRDWFWTDVGIQPVVRGNNLVVSLPATNQVGFFQLGRTK